MQTEAEVQSFLYDAGWADARREKIVADFSTRAFERLSRQGEAPVRAILMRADPDQKTEAFVQVAALLRRIALAVPLVYASDLVRDLVLMEDFGSDKVATRLDAGQDRTPFDKMAAQALAKLHKEFAQPMLGAFKAPLYNAALFTDQATLFLDHYFPQLFRRPATARERSNYVEGWHGILSPLDSLPRTLVLRDFMPDNAMVLSAPLMGQSLGLLDFQDAGIGCIAYDIASWCEEVRRDGGLDHLAAFVAFYHEQNPVVDQDRLLSAARIYAAQRHIRILGLLVKLNRQEFIPRVWRALQVLVKDPALTPVRHWFSSCKPG